MSNSFVQATPSSQNNLSGVLAVGACGLLSSFFVALILSVIELNTELALYSFMLWYIIPAGAIGAGFLAAGGYYLGARIFHHRPGVGSFAWVVFVSILTFFLINFLNYYFLEVEGQYIRDEMSFFAYLDFIITHTVIEYSHRGSNPGNTGELGGVLGYGFAALQILGFSGGGIWICAILKGHVFCDSCRRYFRKKEISPSRRRIRSR
ncbi:MAG: hypothetical protein LBV12_10135 [Puniceicoccales bacterium]|jgi:hypothetical protein|nr:hypothetical protein [Puniceicoccales bacterium]